MSPIRKKRKSKMTAPVTVYFAHVADATNAAGRLRACVYAVCGYSGHHCGPVWGHTQEAVRKCVADLMRKCDCGRIVHKPRQFEGVRSLPPKPGKA